MADFDPTQGGGLIATVTGALLSVLAGWKVWRATNSSDAVTRASNEANISAIATYDDMVKDLRAQLTVERERADKFAEERMAAWEQVHAMSGKIEVLTNQVAQQAIQLQAQSEELGKLRALVAQLPKGNTA